MASMSETEMMSEFSVLTSFASPADFSGLRPDGLGMLAHPLSQAESIAIVITFEIAVVLVA